MDQVLRLKRASIPTVPPSWANRATAGYIHIQNLLVFGEVGGMRQMRIGHVSEHILIYTCTQTGLISTHLLDKHIVQ